MTDTFSTSMTNVVVIDYTNHRGERAKRRIHPLNIFFGTTKWHPKMCWLLRAVDLDKRAFRCFAVADIHEWKEELAEVINRG